MSEARALFMAGRVAFDEGRYDAALKHFSASYELSAKPALLYNIAQCHDRLRQDEQAIEMFERYLELEPGAPNRQAVEARLVVLRNAVSERHQSSAETPRPSSRAEPAKAHEQEREPAQSNAVGPWITIGSGAALVASGAVLMTLAKTKANDVEDADVGSTYENLQHDLDVADRRWKVGQALVGVGLLSTCAGVVWWWLGRPEKTANVKLGFGAESLFVSGKF